MSTPPAVHFENEEFARSLTSQEIAEKLAGGAMVSNTALSIHQARSRPGFGARAPYTRQRLARRVRARYGLTTTQATEISDPGLDRSDETAIAINPRNPFNIVAGAATFDGQQFTNSAYISMDAGNSWQTVTALANTDEGAGLAFDDSGNCYYTTMQGGLSPVCIVSRDGGFTWGQPANFGYGDKTAVAARGTTALVGFDRLNTEACAYTLDGGNTWTVHDFTDSGIGTAPLVSYDQQSFYIIYAALDGNIKVYASHDQGNTWTGPATVVPGNGPQSTIVGPLSYEGGALTSPGTNAAIDSSGTLHVLYIDSAKQVPMYTSSSDGGSSWSTPVNVDPVRAAVPHMWPCLSSNMFGDLQAGSLVYDQVASRYSILRHARDDDSDHWVTVEADNGPWPGAGPSSGFRIGFGDYFDCDSHPELSISAMAWSESPNGLQPWQSWARVFDPWESWEDLVDTLEDEIENLLQGFALQELPIVRTAENVAQFEAHIDGLKQRLKDAQNKLQKRRTTNPLPR
jgi:hypothetical protein